MIELNEKNELDDFEQYFGRKIAQLKTEFKEKFQAKKTIEELYQEKFEEYFKSQKDDFRNYMQAKIAG